MHRPKPPLPKGGGLAKPNRGDSAGWQVSTWVCAYGKCLPWNPSVTPPACQLPLAREPFCARYRSMVRYRAFFYLPIDSVRTKNPKIPRTQTGAGAKTQHPSQSEGSIPDGSTRGILKGGAIRAGASCSPLEPASLRTFLPGQESTAPLASACRKPIGEETQRL